MFAILELGGHQHMVKEKDVLRVNSLELPAGNSLTVDKVLLIHDGKNTKVGTPHVAGAAVEFKVLESGLSDKVVNFKMKSKKRYKRLRGHRQPFTEVEVTKIKA